MINTSSVIYILIFVCFIFILQFIAHSFYSDSRVSQLYTNETVNKVLYVTQPYTYKETTEIPGAPVTTYPPNDMVNTVQKMKEVSNIKLKIPTIGTKCDITKDCSTGLLCANKICKRIIPTYSYKKMAYYNNNKSVVSNYNTSELGQQCGGIVKNLPGNTCNGMNIGDLGDSGNLVCVSDNLLNTTTGTCEIPT
jgi:hypothetical protein